MPVRMTSQRGVAKTHPRCVPSPGVSQKDPGLSLLPESLGKLDRRGDHAESGRAGWSVPGEQSEARP